MISDKATVLLRNTIAKALDDERDGRHPFFSSNYWVDVLKNPKQYKKLDKEVERQAAANEGNSQ